MAEDHQPEEHHGHGDHGGEHSEHIGHGDKPDVHGMFVCGEESVFFSHLPMFDHPHHDFQVLLEVTLSGDGPEDEPQAQAVYFADRKKSKETLYTFAPRPFRLPELATKNDGPAREKFRGTLFRGHFEKGGQPIVEAVARVQTIFHLRQFDPQAERSKQLEYILFGKGPEMFLAHLLTKTPDFDQVVSVTSPEGELIEEDLGRGLRVVFERRNNSLVDRLKKGDEVTGKLLGKSGVETEEITFQVSEELYFEEGELASPPTFDQTQEEAKAGF